MEAVKLHCLSSNNYFSLILLWCLYNVRVFWNPASFRSYMILWEKIKLVLGLDLGPRQHFVLRKFVYWNFHEKVLYLELTTCVINQYWWYFAYTRSLHKQTFGSKISKLVAITCGRGNTCQNFICWKNYSLWCFQMWNLHMFPLPQLMATNWQHWIKHFLSSLSCRICKKVIYIW